jgi:hypothetical protein
VADEEEGVQTRRQNPPVAGEPALLILLRSEWSPLGMRRNETRDGR